MAAAKRAQHTSIRLHWYTGGGYVRSHLIVRWGRGIIAFVVAGEG